MVGEHRDPEAGANLSMRLADVDRRGKLAEDFLADTAGLFLQALALRQAFEDDHEFIAADPRDGVTGPHDIFQATGRGHQHLVTGGVPESVVDRLEPIEVDKYQHHPRGIQARLLQRTGQALLQYQAVGQPRQPVEVRQALQLAGTGFFVGDVAHHPHHFHNGLLRRLDHIAGFP
ncbi:hypothetical protein D3C85_758670 [compost metagenome]